MVVAANSLCMGCMDLKQGGLCPNPGTCDWTENRESRPFPQLSPRTILEHRYVLGRVLGQGGFGITYLAGDLQDYRKLALKEYFPTPFATRTTDRHTVTYAGPSNREPYQYGLKKFEEEGRTLQKFNHANIVSVFRSFNANGTGYIVMEYLDGVNLLDYLKRQPGGKISFDDALRILIPIMDALREVHMAGITHRDVSPDNIYICKSGPIKLLDFGAARLALRDQTQSQQLILKAGYTPEEQYRSAGVAGPWTDIYSLAATMYRCITGQVPPEAPERLSEDTLQTPGRLAKLPAGAEKALMKALAVRAKDRQQSIEEFQRDLRAETLPPPPLPSQPRLRQDGPIGTFTFWWTIAGVLMLLGSLFRSHGGLWVFGIGLIPAVVSLLQFVRSRGQIATAALGGERRGLGPWLLFGFSTVLGIVLTGVNPLGAAVLVANVFIARAVIVDAPVSVPAKLGLRCITGELAGNTLELGTEPIVIGRDPDLANVVIPEPEISGAHARVWLDAGTGAPWIEDLESRNGTYILKPDTSSGWVEVHERQALSKGDRFYLCGDELAMFEIVEG